MTSPTPVMIIVQARMESTRFPGKVLAPLLGQPMLLWQLAAVQRLALPHTLVVACPDTAPNQAIAACCEQHGYPCMLVPGDPDDVLGRFRAVAAVTSGTEVLRLTGDCPLTCPDVLEGLLAMHHRRDRLPRQVDHTGIGLTWGDGFDAELLRREALAQADREATIASDREHVTPYLWRQPERFLCRTYPCPFDLSWLRLSVDTPEDLAMVATLLATVLDRVGLGYGWRDVWQTVERFPELKRQMLAKPHNPAYLAQVQVQSGVDDPWHTLRYGAASKSLEVPHT